jgi:hypothetical protein
LRGIIALPWGSERKLLNASVTFHGHLYDS